MSEVQKKWKTNVWNPDLGEKMQKKIKEMFACSRVEKIFVLVTRKSCAKEIYSVWWKSDLKNKSPKYENKEKLRFEYSIWVKNDFVFFQNNASFRHRR